MLTDEVFTDVIKDANDQFSSFSKQELYILLLEQQVTHKTLLMMLSCSLQYFSHISFLVFCNAITIYLFRLRWVFVAAHRLSLVAASRGYSSLWCMGFSLQWLLLLSTGSGRTGSVVVAHRLSCSAACGIFLDQGSNLCPLHWPAGSLTTAPPGKSHISFLNLTDAFSYMCTYFHDLHYAFLSLSLSSNVVSLAVAFPSVTW